VKHIALLVTSGLVERKEHLEVLNTSNGARLWLLVSDATLVMCHEKALESTPASSKAYSGVFSGNRDTTSIQLVRPPKPPR